MLPDTELDALAGEIRAAQDRGVSLAPFTGRHAGFDLEAGYAVAARLHGARLDAGAVARGRKIGFTNSNIWPEYDVHQPIWGWVYAHTLHEAGAAPVQLPLGGLVEPKIEPEIAFGLKAAPPAGADTAALLACIDWVAPAFEVVQSHFPGWKFQAADTVADGGLHGRLLLGTRVPLAQLGPDPAGALAGLQVALSRDGHEVEIGRGANVLGSPLAALAHLVALLDGQGPGVALQLGEVVTTGTVTAAYPIRPGEHWRAAPRGVSLAPLAVEFVA
ncbi:MAG TPA: fumarylacetoacetate hydrolase family protein [Ramlibacter sp.]|jgi:2-oxo-3-hexenedioate decarboxylase|uniref:2-keto-4-pentenoate hydratase n=1 Tax=Ramlibacter sp. TaxID=1917967 RepID=UPI002D512EEE|nr:fumarylacetoacetate hydrolase family protein [Ramlibacter sp.]HZY18978.1 fumarylacetoacetate hydrolase family protein [Ramlibacter sp.]